jgi:hypothetical protein
MDNLHAINKELHESNATKILERKNIRFNKNNDTFFLTVKGRSATLKFSDKRTWNYETSYSIKEIPAFDLENFLMSEI